MLWQRIRTILCIGLLGISWTSSADVSSGIVQQSLGRDFGVVTGDRITHEFVLQLPAGYELSESSLPVPGDLNYWLTLDDVAVEALDSNQIRQLYRLTLQYQTFYAPLDVRTLETPAHSLRAHIDGKASVDIRLPAWSFTMSPLKDIPQRGFGTDDTNNPFMKPALEPPLKPTNQLQQNVIVLGIAITILTFLWAFLKGWIWRRRQSPFQLAYRRVKRLAASKEVSIATYRTAFQAIHEAFNRVSGSVLFACQIPEFLVQNPEFSRYEQEINDFFQQSDAVLFREETEQLPDLSELRHLTRRLCHAETLTVPNT